jgi:homoserine kinase
VTDDTATAGGPQPRHHTVRVPATTANLGPGFDAFGLALDLHLAVRSVAADGGPRVVTTGEGAGEVPGDDTNLVWTALVAFCDAYGLAVPDVALRATNRIPLERGLGSSSAAIVAGLVLGRDLTGHAVSELELVRLADAIEGHPDNVAPAIVGGLVACARGADGAPVVRRIDPAPDLTLVACVPQARQSTREARAVLPDTLPRAEVGEQAARAGHVLGALAGWWPVDAGLAGDLLHEPPRLAAMGPTGALVGRLRADGHHAWLSGAGPSVAVAVATGDTAARDAVTAAATEQGFWGLALEVDRSGAVSCPDGGCALAGMGGCARCPREAL